MSCRHDVTLKDAVATALRLLGNREHSEAELRRKLTAAGVSSALLFPVCEYCRRHGWLNEQRFAEMLIRRRARKGYGPHYIEAELRQHGLSQEAIDRAREQAPVDWLDVCRMALDKQRGTRCLNEAACRRLGQYLYRRGFAADMIRAVLACG